MPPKSIIKPLPAIVLAPEIVTLSPDSVDFKLYEFTFTMLVDNINAVTPHANVTYAFEDDHWTLIGASGGDVIEIFPLSNSCFRIKYMAGNSWTDCCYKSTGLYNMLVWAVCNYAYKSAGV
jgi:hypothetical protein